MQADSPSSNRIPFHQSIPLALILFAFWVVLSGKLDLFHLGAGAASAIGIALLSCRLYSITPPVGRHGRHPFYTMPWIRLLGYLPWLAAQIVIAAVQVARIVLSPRMRLDPVVVRFEHPLPHNLARATLANSITLTPGTVTIDVLGDEFIVHALTADAATPLEKTRAGDMKSRVSSVFGGKP